MSVDNNHSRMSWREQEAAYARRRDNYKPDAAVSYLKLHIELQLHELNQAIRAINKYKEKSRTRLLSLNDITKYRKAELEKVELLGCLFKDLSACKSREAIATELNFYSSIMCHLPRKLADLVCLLESKVVEPRQLIRLIRQ